MKGFVHVIIDENKEAVMRFGFPIFFLLLISAGTYPKSMFPGERSLAPCPKSFNCVCTQASGMFKRMDPLVYTGPTMQAVERLEKLVEVYPNATLIEKDENYLHYSFETKIGHFIDDVEFLAIDSTKEIHFRSASRVGYGDFGKNRRRMKGIQKRWKSNGK